MKRLNYQDIHDMLVNQLSEISDNKTTGDQLVEEIKKANAMTGLAASIISLGHLQLKGAKHFGAGSEDETEALFIKQKND